VKIFAKYILLAAVAFLLGQSVSGCKKPLFNSKGNLEFSEDTLVFDTIFTTIGSTTQQFKIYNKDSRTLNIEQIELMGGANSPFRLNFDGVPGIVFSDIEVLGNDSLFAFVDVTLAVNGQTLPLVIEDSIRFRTNGTDQYVKLTVWGQDAYFHYRDDNNGTWLSDKPHVIYDFAFVGPNNSLTIQQDAKVYLHKDSYLAVKEGSLHVAGTLGHEVVFQGDRLEPFYQNATSQYYGIYLDSVLPSTINYAIIKNGTAGVHVTGTHPSNPPYGVEITNTKILNNSSYGLFLYAGAKVRAENCVIAKNGIYALFVLRGANYNLNNCTILGYGNADSQEPAVGIKNYFKIDGITYYGDIPEGKITNSIIYGNLAKEIGFDTTNEDNTIDLNFQFKNCLIQAPASAESMFVNIFWGTNPRIADVSAGDYKINSDSGAINAADAATAAVLDITGFPRSNPDIGAYEFH
jgi:hypothetical protein